MKRSKPLLTNPTVRTGMLGGSDAARLGCSVFQMVAAVGTLAA
jgi:hypothetical protein